MPFEFGDVVLVPFPFTSQVASKKRPAVIERIAEMIEDLVDRVTPGFFQRLPRARNQRI